ncbi:unnamed protein product [Phytomonas sp. EM1]|nr:unnamed protein product [Phytomonas sp. EM1]|eukprot:CCW59977.1 unnamed protein product [Phytomonas sp. isolate EM1]
MKHNGCHSFTFDILLSSIFIISSAALILSLCIVTSDQILYLSNEENIVLKQHVQVTPIHNLSNFRADNVESAKENEVVVIPQLDASIGFLRTCIIASCFYRSSLKGPVPFVERFVSESKKLKVYDSFRNALEEAVDQLNLGYELLTLDVSHSSHFCITLKYALASIAIVALSLFSLGCSSISLLYIITKIRSNWTGLTHMERSSGMNERITICGDLTFCNVYEIKSRLRYALLSVIVTSNILAVIFSIGAVSASTYVVSGDTEYGATVCNSFIYSMNKLRSKVNVLNNEDPTSPLNMSKCSPGSTFWMLVAEPILCILAMVCTTRLFFYYKSCVSIVALQQPRG